MQPQRRFHRGNVGLFASLQGDSWEEWPTSEAAGLSSGVPTGLSARAPVLFREPCGRSGDFNLMVRGGFKRMNPPLRLAACCKAPQGPAPWISAFAGMTENGEPHTLTSRHSERSEESHVAGKTQRMQPQRRFHRGHVGLFASLQSDSWEEWPTIEMRGLFSGVPMGLFCGFSPPFWRVAACRRHHFRVFRPFHSFHDSNGGPEYGLKGRTTYEWNRQPLEPATFGVRKPRLRLPSTKPCFVVRASVSTQACPKHGFGQGRLEHGSSTPKSPPSR